MKYRTLLFVSAVLALILIRHAGAETPRPIFASSVYNGAGYLYIPTVTPLGNRACFFDDNSTVASSVTTGTELAFLHGATSNIQAQINAITAGASARTTVTTTVSLSIPTLSKDYILNVNTGMGPLTETLPDSVASNGFCADIKNIGPSVVTIAPPFGQTIDGFSSDSLVNQNDSTHYCAISGNWFKY